MSERGFGGDVSFSGGRGGGLPTHWKGEPRGFLAPAPTPEEQAEALLREEQARAGCAAQFQAEQAELEAARLSERALLLRATAERQVRLQMPLWKRQQENKRASVKPAEELAMYAGLEE